MSFFLLLSIFFISLENENTSDLRQVPLNEAFTIELHEKVIVEGSNLKVRYKEIVQNSLCPPNAKCAWEGRMRINILINDSLFELSTFRQDANNSIDFPTSAPLYKVKIANYNWYKDEFDNAVRIKLIVETI